MSNNIEKAQALRALADIFESGDLPEAQHDDQSINILVIYPTEDARDQAQKVLIDAGCPLRKWGRGEGDRCADIGAGGAHFAGVEFAMTAHKGR